MSPLFSYENESDLILQYVFTLRYTHYGSHMFFNSFEFTLELIIYICIIHCDGDQYQNF